jgi:hypothetical protein
MILLFLMTFVLKTSTRLMVWTTALAAVAMILVSGTVLALQPAPVAAEETIVATTLVDQIVAGQDLYSVHCVECHGDDGSTAIIEGGGPKVRRSHPSTAMTFFTPSRTCHVRSHCLRTSQCRHDLFGKAYGGEISKSEIEYCCIHALPVG